MAGTEETSGGMVAEENKLRVLVPIDESEGSFYALRWALDNLFGDYAAAGGGGSELVQDPNTITLVNVQPVFQPFIYPAGPASPVVVYATPQVIEAVKKGQEANAADILSRGLQLCSQKKVKAETLILEGDAKDKICQAAEQLHVDLVVIGSRGLGPIKRAFLGSVSDYCVHHVQCPVIVVKPPPASAHSS